MANSLAFIDRSNIGNARIAGMYEDLSLYGLRYNTAVTIFFVPYTIVSPHAPSPPKFPPTTSTS
jgi:hypothetical protein